ncbi:MAG: hypothetical protein GXP24_05370 [Planctomycetes bacterium]|nr:hypothetical protein [Planctomycetota bacterium]
MTLKPHILELVAVYRREESSDTRGPRFKELALALEGEMKAAHVTEQMLLDCFGPPDLFDDEVFVYHFDHEQPGRNNYEWYFPFKNGKLSNSGYNACGINDLSELKKGSEFQ